MSTPHPNSRRTLAILLCSFLLPLFMAMYLFINHSHWHFKTTNVGTLLPTLPLIESLHPTTNAAFTTQQEGTPWTLALLRQDCHDNCEQTLAKLNSVHQSLGKNIYRISQSLLTTTTISTNQIKQIHQVHPEVAQFQTVSSSAHPKALALRNQTSGLIFLADPEGRILMTYPENVPGNGILRDLRHLLKLAQG